MPPIRLDTIPALVGFQKGAITSHATPSCVSGQYRTYPVGPNLTSGLGYQAIDGNRVGGDIQPNKAYFRHEGLFPLYAALRRWVHLIRIATRVTAQRIVAPS
jgi:hypothetical protein